MRKLSYLLLAIIIIICTCGKCKAQAQKADTTAKQQFVLTGSLQFFQVLIATLENPEKALHVDVKALEQIITEQVQKQLPQQKQTSKQK